MEISKQGGIEVWKAGNFWKGRVLGKQAVLFVSHRKTVIYHLYKSGRRQAMIELVLPIWLSLQITADESYAVSAKAAD